MPEWHYLLWQARKDDMKQDDISLYDKRQIGSMNIGWYQMIWQVIWMGDMEQNNITHYMIKGEEMMSHWLMSPFKLNVTKVTYDK